MGSVYRPNHRDPGTGKRMKYKHWRIAWKDEHGQRRTERTFRDKSASEALLRRREQEVERLKASFSVVGDAERRRKLTDSIEGFGLKLISRGNEPAGKHVTEACGWRTLAEIRRARFTEYLAALAQGRRAPQTRNQHLSMLRNFCSWLVDQRWLAENPAADLKPTRVGQSGRLRVRRAELSRLLAATTEPRRTLYRLAALSGFHRKELQRMESQDVDPLGERPRWPLRASVSKNGRQDVVPIVPDILPAVRRIWLAAATPSTRLVGSPLLACKLPRHETLHADLERAGVARIDSQGRHADFHGFRYTFCRLMGEVLMRHSTIKLMADLYTQLGIDVLDEDVWTLPPLGLAAA